MKTKTCFRLIFLFLTLLCVTGCDDDKDEIVLMTVSATPGYIVPWGADFPMEYVSAMEDGEIYSSYFHPKEIEGFAYERGYEYRIRVRKIQIENPPADGSSIRYVWINTLSQTKVEGAYGKLDFNVGTQDIQIKGNFTEEEGKALEDKIKNDFPGVKGGYTCVYIDPDNGKGEVFAYNDMSQEEEAMCEGAFAVKTVQEDAGRYMLYTFTFPKGTITYKMTIYDGDQIEIVNERRVCYIWTADLTDLYRADYPGLEAVSIKLHIAV